MAVKIKVQTNTADIIAKIQAGKAAMIPAVAEQALANCNYFARRDQGTMIESSQTASDLKKGDLVWNTSYAKKVYYTGTPSKDNNPNASLMWCEKAQAEFGEDWEKIGQKSFAKGIG